MNKKSLKNELEWLINTQDVLNVFSDQCKQAADNVDQAIQYLQVNVYEELYQSAESIYPNFQQSAQELYADIKEHHQPYLQKQIEVLISTIEELKA